jgi:hypothetical protein
MLGLSHDYKNLSQWLDDNLVPAKAAAYRMGDKRCVNGNMNFSNTDMGQYMRRGYSSIHDNVVQSVAFSTGVMGLRATPKIPWYIYHAAADDVSPQILTDTLYGIHCKNKANILYERNPLPLNHRAECVAGLAGAYRWMVDRHEGRAITPGCSTVSVSMESVRGTAQSLLIQGLLSNLWAYLGWEVGPDWNWWDELKSRSKGGTASGKGGFLAGDRTSAKKTGWEWG